jgi:hypothetical protein
MGPDGAKNQGLTAIYWPRLDWNTRPDNTKQQVHEDEADWENLKCAVGICRPCRIVKV